MTSKIISAAPIGYNAEIIEVEGDSSKGLPSLQIVGMGNKAIDESKERVRSAIKNSSLDFPAKKITINLAPAEIPKDGTTFDLPIAISILSLSGQIKPIETKGKAFVGELSLSGGIRPVKGVLNILEALQKSGIEEVFIPFENLDQAELIEGTKIIGAKNLKEIFLHLKGEKQISNEIITSKEKIPESSIFLDDIIGQDHAKRAMTIAIAGRHNILLTGPPGTGKTMLAKAALSLLPPLSPKEKIEVAKIHGLVSDIDTKNLTRPFRAPHHTASRTSIIGGGSKATPGEISLAHLGVLFLDEIPEYPKTILESLRQPLEDKQISISRTKYRSTYPADFMMIATMNPCPCGFLGDDKKECTCSSSQIVNYQRKISGPLMDRIDMVITVNRIDNKNLLSKKPSSYTQHNNAIKLVKTSLLSQHKRFNCSNIYNSSAKTSSLHSFNLSNDAKNLLDTAASKMDLSARSYFKIVKVSRTIADMENSKNIEVSHVAEALQYRQK